MHASLNPSSARPLLLGRRDSCVRCTPRWALISRRARATALIASTGASHLCAARFCSRHLGLAPCACYGASFDWRQPPLCSAAFVQQRRLALGSRGARATALASTGAGRLCAALSSCNSGSVCLCFRCLGPARCACYGAAFSWRQAFARRCFRAAAAACASALVALGSRGVNAMTLTLAGAGRTCATRPSTIAAAYALAPIAFSSRGWCPRPVPTKANRHHHPMRVGGPGEGRTHKRGKSETFKTNSSPSSSTLSSQHSCRPARPPWRLWAIGRVGGLPRRRWEGLR